ncbi:hypothetical protein M758_1G152100 [Ceratodon purpureus]|nr:hypothetical protein M758_1G152100 [Ceratodon purpureus]
MLVCWLGFTRFGMCVFASWKTGLVHTDAWIWDALWDAVFCRFGPLLTETHCQDPTDFILLLGRLSFSKPLQVWLLIMVMDGVMPV